VTPYQLERIDGAFEKMFSLLAGDTWTFVDKEGIETDIVCIANNLKLENKPGLIIDKYGMLEQSVIELLFKKSWLDTAGITVSVEGHWIKNGKRYDFAKNEEVMEFINPVGGLHNILSVRVRESSERNQTVPKDPEELGSGWDFEWDEN
jgi:hypothetical protein